MYILRRQNNSHSSYYLYKNKLKAVRHYETCDENSADKDKKDSTQIKKRLEYEYHHRYRHYVDVFWQVFYYDTYK